MRPLVGGSIVTLARDLETANRIALDWLDDGTILYERQSPNARQIVRISENGEPIDVVWPREGQFAPVWLRGLPDARGALLIACEGLAVACEGSRAELHAIDLRNLSSEVLLEQVIAVWYAQTGHIIYVRADGVVFAVPFDVEGLEITGGAIPLFEGVRLGSNVAEMRLGQDGTLLYVEGGGNAFMQREVVWVDRTGRAEPVAEDLTSTTIRAPALSPDGRRLALSMGDAGNARNVRVKELPDGALTRITSDPGLSDGSVWSADGATISYRTTDGGVAHARTVRSDGSLTGDFEILLQREGNVGEVLFTRDGRGLIFSESEGTGLFDIRLLDLETDSIHDLLASDFNERAAALSPDGRWLAYVSDETGPLQVFVRPFPSTGSSRTQVSTTTGREPVWAHNGRELFYREVPGVGQGNMMVATYTAESVFEVRARELLFDANPYLTSPDSPQYDVGADDERFVMISMTSGTVGGGDEASARLILVQNWFTELKELMGN